MGALGDLVWLMIDDLTDGYEHRSEGWTARWMDAGFKI